MGGLDPGHARNQTEGKGYRGKAPVLTPRGKESVRNMELDQAGAGVSRQRSGLLAGLPLISKNKRECPVGTPFLFSLAVSGLGKGAPVRVPPAGGPRPTRPYGLRAVTLPTLCGGGAAARPVTALQAVPGNVAAGRRRLAAYGGSCSAASAAAQVCAPAALASRQPLLGAPLPQSKAKSSRLRRALLCSFPSPVAA